MKARTIITAALILISSASIFANPNRTLTFRDAMGRILEQPIAFEELAEEVPAEIRAEFARIRQNGSSRVFDLSEMLEPETEEPLPFDLEKVFRQASAK